MCVVAFLKGFEKAAKRGLSISRVILKGSRMGAGLLNRLVEDVAARRGYPSFCAWLHRGNGDRGHGWVANRLG